MPSIHPLRKVKLNEFAVINLALFGPKDRAEELFVQTSATLRRLRLNTRRTKTEFTKTPRGGVGDYPCMQNIILWLNDIQRTDKYTDEMDFLKKLHVTLKQRVG